MLVKLTEMITTEIFLALTQKHHSTKSLKLNGRLPKMEPTLPLSKILLFQQLVAVISLAQVQVIRECNGLKKLIE